MLHRWLTSVSHTAGLSVVLSEKLRGIDCTVYGVSRS